jgi:hypothetical protein
MKGLLATLLAGVTSCAIAVETESTSTAKAPELDGFPTGPWQGMNAVYQAKNFDAFLMKNMDVRIQPKNNGKAVGAPVLVRFTAYFVSDHRTVRRDLVSLDKRPAPAMQPRRIDLAGQYEHKVKFTHSIAFSERGVTVEGDAKDPAVIKQPTVFAYWVSFPASHHIPKETPEAEVKRLTEGHSITFLDAQRKKEAFGFWQAIQPRANAVLEAEASGQWGPRRIVVEAPPTPKNGRRIGNFGNYAVAPFHRGGWYFSRSATNKVEGGPLTVKVE